MIYTFVEMYLVSPIFTDLQATVHDCVKRWLLIATKYAMKYFTDFLSSREYVKAFNEINTHLFLQDFHKTVN